MAGADSTIRVNIIGDAKSLQQASAKSEKAVGGIGKAAKIAGGAIVAAFAADAVLDFTQTALAESDRLGDATTRLEAQLGDLSQPIEDAADSLHSLGQSRGDVLELSARFTDLAKAAHLTDDAISGNALSVVEAASALSLLGEADAATILDQIGKAAGGADRPLKELGVSLTDAEVEARAMADTGKANADALTEQELAAARLALIMEKLQPRILAVTEGEADLEQRQSELQARFETLTGRIGQAVEGPLNDFLGWVLAGIDGLGQLDQFLALVEQGFRDVLGPIARVADALAGVLRLIDETLKGLNLVGDRSRYHPIYNPTGTGAPGGGGGVTLQVQGGSPEVIEQAVRNALSTANGHGPLE